MACSKVTGKLKHAELQRGRRTLTWDNIIPTTFMLRVTFSPAPECVEVDCWNQAFQTPPCHQDGVIVIVIIVIVVVPALTKGYIGNAFSGRRLLLH